MVLLPPQKVSSLRTIATVWAAIDKEMCVCVCVSQMPEEWQARQAIPAILQVSSSTTQRKLQQELEARFISVCVCYEKKNVIRMASMTSDTGDISSK